MKTSHKTVIAAAAMAGLFAGSQAAQAAASSDQTATAGVSLMGAKEKGTHACKGQNECKGQGGCKTGDNGCKGKNSCKGKGGCSTEKKEKK